MRRIWLLFLFPALAWGQSHEILRPTADVNGNISLATTIDGGCLGAVYSASLAQPNWYDSGGLSTSSSFNVNESSQSAKRCDARVFKTWATTANTYTALTLNINAAATAATGNPGVGSLAYSLNSGSTWTVISTGGSGLFSQQTFTVSLSTSQNLSNIWIVAVGDAPANDSVNNGDVTVTGFDIWTDGVYTPPTPTPTPNIAAPPTVASPPAIISKATFWHWWAMLWR